MKKKIVCLIMGMVMAVSCMPTIAFAETINEAPTELSTEGVKDLLLESDISKYEVASELGTITNEVEILNAFGYDTNTITGADVESGEVVYSIEANGTGGISDVIEAEVAITETVDGDVTMKFTEYAQQAALVFTNDGKIFLDGDEIVITEETAPSVEGSAIYRMSTVPYGCGSASKYTYYGGIKKWNIEFNNFICKTPIVVCASVIAWGVGGGLGVAILLPTSNQIVNYATTTDGKALSARSKMYYNTDYDRFMISSSQGCRKELTDFYSTGHYTHKMNSTPLQTYYYFMMPGC